MIEEAGDRDPSGARLGAMLQVMLARYPSERLPEIKCWWPQALVPPQVKVAAATPTQEVLMIRPLRDRILPLPPLRARKWCTGTPIYLLILAGSPRFVGVTSFRS